MPPCSEATKPANKRRKRKGSQAAGGGVGLSKKGASPRPNFSLASQVRLLEVIMVMVIALPGRNSSLASYVRFFKVRDEKMLLFCFLLHSFYYKIVESLTSGAKSDNGRYRT